MRTLVKFIVTLTACSLALYSCNMEQAKGKGNTLIGTWKSEMVSSACRKIFTLTFESDGTLTSTCVTIQNGQEEETEYSGIYIAEQSPKVTIALRQGEKAVVKTLMRNNTQLILSDSDNFKEIGLIYEQVK